MIELTQKEINCFVTHRGSYENNFYLHSYFGSVFELYNEIHNNNAGYILLDGLKILPIINVKVKYPEYEDILSIAILGFIETDTRKFSQYSNQILFYVVPCNDDTAKHYSAKYSIDIFERHSDYFEAIEKTDDTLVLRYDVFLDMYPKNLETNPMLEPIEYISQELYKNHYVLKQINDCGIKHKVKVPVVYFYENTKHGEVAQPYSYNQQYEEINGNSYYKITLTKIDKDNVIIDKSPFMVDKEF